MVQGTNSSASYMLVQIAHTESTGSGPHVQAATAHINTPNDIDMPACLKSAAFNMTAAAVHASGACLARQLPISPSCYSVIPCCVSLLHLCRQWHVRVAAHDLSIVSRVILWITLLMLLLVAINLEWHLLLSVHAVA